MTPTPLRRRDPCPAGHQPVALILGLIAMALLATPVAQAGPSPTQAIQGTIEAVLTLLANDTLKEPQRAEERREQIEQTVGQRFDYEELAKRSLAKHWRQMDDLQRREFVTLFQRLVADQYSKRIENYSGEKVEYLKERREGPYAEVQTRIVSGQDAIDVDYRMLNKDGNWRVYDVVIEGVSLVSNYRGQFDRIIRNSSYSGLLEKLRNRSDEIRPA